MDLLNLAIGSSGASDLPQLTAAEAVAPLANSADAMTGTGFSDTLLSTLSGLLAGKVQSQPESADFARRAPQSEESDKAKDEQTVQLPEADAPLLLLNALLTASQTPARTLQLSTTRDEAPTAVALSSAAAAIQYRDTSLPNVTSAALPPTFTAVAAPHEAQASAVKEPPVNTVQPTISQVSAPVASLNAEGLSSLLVPATQSAAPDGVTAATVAPRAELPLPVDREQQQWAQQLKSALGERLQIQLKDQVQHATIRLDPPEMGKIDIALKLDNGRVQVQISASHAEVYRALQQTSSDLRQSLTEQNFMQVNVQVSSQSGQQQQQGKGHAFGEPQAAIIAGAEISGAERDALRQDDSVLLTV